MSENDSLTLALIFSNEAQAILERNSLSVKEVKDAQKLFKQAAKTLGASIVLMNEGCYLVATNPKE
jgi:hypothetical protein